MPYLTEMENLQLVLDGKQPEWVPNFFDACSFASSIVLGRNSNIDPKTGYAVDIFGTEFTSTIDGPMPVHTINGEFRLKDVRDYKKVMPTIDLSKVDWETDAATIRHKFTKEGQMVNYNAGYVWEELHYMMGFENALLSLALYPEACNECLNAIADFWIEAMRYQYKYLKPEIIMFMEHISNAKSMLMSPKTYREVIKPVHKKMYDAIIELGAIPEMHVDGYVEDILPDYAELGIKLIQPFQVFNDINAAKEKYGFIAFGGWDAFGPGNQPDSTEEDVRASVRLAFDTYAPGNRYVFMEAGATPANPGRREIIKDEAQKYGHAYFSKTAS